MSDISEILLTVQKMYGCMKNTNNEIKEIHSEIRALRLDIKDLQKQMQLDKEPVINETTEEKMKRLDRESRETSFANGWSGD